jgi:hypothetical protein
MNALTVPAMPMQDMQILADAIARSNLFGIKTKEQALVLMMIARSEGRDPVEAARDYDIIQGKPAKKAEAMLRDFLVAGGKVEWHELSDIKADATFTHPQTGSVRIDWDLARANVAGFGGKDMWKKFPRQMLRSRVVSEGVRTLWPLATSGMYVPEEQADIPTKASDAGETIDGTVETNDADDPRTAFNNAVPLKAAAAPMPRGARIAEKAPAYEAPERPRTERTDDQWRAWLDKLRGACEVLYRRSEVVELGERASVGDALATGPQWVQREISAILAENYKRFPDEDAAGDDLADVEIVGADKVAAG